MALIPPFCYRISILMLIQGDIHWLLHIVGSHLQNKLSPLKAQWLAHFITDSCLTKVKAKYSS